MKIHHLLILLSLGALAVGCGEGFDSRTLIQGYRVMGLRADPPEVTPTDTVEITAFDFNTDPGAVNYEWSVCLYSFGAQADFECVDPALEFPLGSDGPTVSLNLAEFDLASIAAEIERIREENAELLSNAPFEIDDDLAFYVRLISGPPGGRIIQTVHRVPVNTPDSASPPNVNPEITRFVVGGAERGDARGSVDGQIALALATAEGSEEDYIEESDGEEIERTEELVYTWYTTGGELDPPLTFGEDTDTVLKLPDEPGEIAVFVAVRDGRGGLALRGPRMVVVE